MTGSRGTFVKVCGITTVADAQAAVRAGANAVGFVLAPSPRRVSVYRAHQIARHVHPSVWKFGIFVDATFDAIAAAVGAVPLDWVQLHGSEPRALVDRLRAHCPDLKIARAIRVRAGEPVPRVEETGADVVVVDSKDPSRPGEGQGAIPLPLLRALGPGPYVVAGGLTPETVAGVLREVRPWGVDVSSGVEAAPGRKDPAKLRAFVRAVRAAGTAHAPTARG